MTDLPTPPSWTGEFAGALGSAGYDYDTVAEVLGTTAQAALGRNETTPGYRVTGGGSPVETLIRLWLLQRPVPLAHAEDALPGLVDRLCAVGILEQSVSEVAARVDVRPYQADETNLWIASDLTPGLDGSPQRVGADHVLGISSAATSLAQLTVRRPARRALDLGTGCGVQSLHLSGHSGHVVATDVNRRALWLTGLNAALNGVTLDIRDGSFFEPVHSERFDLIATNPPFVISPATGERLVYRDSGLPGDRVVEDIVRMAPAHLTEGGLCQILANWMIAKDQSWDERLAGWIDGAAEPVDAWVVQREVVDLPTYVELWLKDAGLHGGPDYERRYDTWLSWFDEQGAEAVGFGWINLRRPTDEHPVDQRFDDWPYAVQQPIGPEIADHFDRVDWRPDDAELSGTDLVVRADVVQETIGDPGAEDPRHVVLRQQAGLCRARDASTAEAAFVGACDGELSVGQLIDALATLGYEVDLDLARSLVADGFLEPAT